LGKGQCEGDLGNDFYFLPVLFKMMLLILVFCSLFKSMVDPCRVILNANVINYLLSYPFSIAMATKENMTSQRGMLKSIQSKMNTLANHFPAVNSLIQRINLRKRRDSLILGSVIGVCTILLLLYAFH